MFDFFPPQDHSRWRQHGSFAEPWRALRWRQQASEGTNVPLEPNLRAHTHVPLGSRAVGLLVAESVVWGWNDERLFVDLEVVQGPVLGVDLRRDPVVGRGPRFVAMPRTMLDVAVEPEDRSAVRNHPARKSNAKRYDKMKLAESIAPVMAY